MDCKFSKLCRLCASSMTLGYSIFAKCDGLDFQQLIKKYIGIDISKDESLPSSICDECRLTVRSFDNFATKCVEIQNDFFNILLSDKLNNEAKDEPEDDSIKKETVDFVDYKVEDMEYLDMNDDYCDEQEDSRKVLRNGKKTKKLPRNKKVKKKKKSVKVDLDDVDYNPTTSLKNVSKSSKQSRRRTGRPYKHDYSILKYICHVCNEEFPNFPILAEHTVTKHNTRAQIVCICNEVVTSMKNVRMHLSNHFDENKKSYCEKCEKFFLRRQKFEQHMREFHTDEKYMLYCNSCDKTFMNLTALKKHEAGHLPKEITHIYKCEKCDNRYKSPLNLKLHVELVHDKTVVKMKYICDMCAKEFHSKYLLRTHILRHSNIRRHKCLKCPKRFVTKVGLKKHADTHGDVKYRCTLCSMVLNSKSTLSAHYVIHEGIFKYKCRFCDKEYKRNCDRKHHENRHLGITPYACPWCPKKFVDNSHLRNHKKSQHPKELAEYEAIHGAPQGALKVRKEEDPKVIIPLSIRRSTSYMSKYF